MQKLNRALLFDTVKRVKKFHFITQEIKQEILSFCQANILTSQSERSIFKLLKLALNDLGSQ